MKKTIILLMLLCSVCFGTNYYIASDGNDVDGDGTSGDPFLTFAKAFPLCNNGDTIYVADGTYTGATFTNTIGGTTSFKGNNITVNVTASSAIGVASPVFQIANTAYGMLITSANTGCAINFTNITWDLTDYTTAAYAVNVINSSVNVNFRACKFQNGKQFAVSSASYTGTITCTNCEMVQVAGATDNYLFELMGGSLTLNYSATYLPAISSYTYTNSLAEVTGDPTAYTISDSTIVPLGGSSSYMIKFTTAGVTLTSCTITNCTIGTVNDPLLVHLFVDTVGTTATNLTISGCTIRMGGSTTMVSIYGASTIFGDVSIHDNVVIGAPLVNANIFRIGPDFNGSATDSVKTIGNIAIYDNDFSVIKHGISIQQAATGVYIARNTFSHIAAAGLSILVGKEVTAGSADTYVNNYPLLGHINILDNTIIKSADSAHAILCGLGAKNCRVEGNDITGSFVGIVLKDNFSVVTDNIVKCQLPMWLAGASYCDIYNNTFIGSDTADSLNACLVVKTSNDGTTTSISNRFWNNIFYAKSGAHSGMAINIEDNTWNNWLDYNCYWSASTGANIAKIGATLYAADDGIWTGYSTIFGTTEINSIVADPQFVNTTDYIPRNSILRLPEGYIGSETPTINKPWLK